MQIKLVAVVATSFGRETPLKVYGNVERFIGILWEENRVYWYPTPPPLQPVNQVLLENRNSFKRLFLPSTS